MKSFLFLRTIRARILLLLAFVFCVVLLTATYRAIDRRDADVTASKNRIKSHVEYITATQIRALRDVQRFLGILVKTQHVDILEQDSRCADTFADLAGEDPRIANIFIVKTNGEVICNPHPPLKPVNLSDRDYFRQALATSVPIVGEPVFGRFTNKWVLPVALSYRSASGKVNGLVVVSLDLDWVNSEYDKGNYPEGTRLGLIESKGKVLVRYPDPERLTGTDASGTPGFKAMMAQLGSGMVESPSHDGVTRIFAFKEFTQTVSGSIYLWIALPLSSVTEMADQQFEMAIMLTLALVVLTFAAAWFGCERWVIRPIEIIGNTVHRLGAGDHLARTKLPKSDDEIGHLANMVDEMAISLTSKSELLRLNRALEVLSKANRALVHATSEAEQLQQICQIIVDVGGYRMTWVGFAENDEAKTVRPVAQYGYSDGYLERAHITWADSERGRGPTGSAIRTRSPQVNLDFENNKMLAPWKEDALRRGYRSSTAIPLMSELHVIGALTIYSEVVDAFNTQELQLIKELADDLAFGIMTQRLRRSHEEALLAVHQSEQRFHTAFMASPDALAITSLEDGEFLEINDSYTTIVGWTKEDIRGKTVKDINVWRYPQERQKLVQPLLHSGECMNLEAEFVRKDGSCFIGLLSAHLMQIEGKTCILSIFRDISAQKAAQEQIHNLSFSDTLTGLPNRRLFRDRLAQSMIACEHHHEHSALVYVDLDDFKSINETLGHDQGDLLLKEVGQRLVRCVKETDTVARLGGDEFALILRGLSTIPEDAASQARTICTRILSDLDLPYELGGTTLHRTCSVGITMIVESNLDAAELLKRAELAMYQAKVSGRNALRFFEPQMQEAVNARALMEDGLRKAIYQHQMLLYYQPQVGADGRITGVESLIRWKDPHRGMISPAEFIPLAEVTGLILPLGQWVLEAACGQLAQWASRPAMAHLTLAVNVSARQFHQPQFVEEVLVALERSGANPNNLKLELTESMLVDDIGGVINKMKMLKAKGVGFSLDDFGTGYSSLSYLKLLPLDQLKIDQGFVRDILVDPNDAAIAKTVVALAESMGLDVIAEGVETAAQRDALAALGCHHYQGYLYSRPLPVEELEVFIGEILN